MITKSATSTLQRLSKVDRERIRLAIDRLPEGDVLRMKGVPDQYRARVGDWRVRFTVNRKERVLTVLAIKPRGDAYKGA